MSFETGSHPETGKETRQTMLSSDQLRELAPDVFDVEKVSREVDTKLTLTNIARASAKENGTLEKYVARYTDSRGLNYYLSRNINHSMPDVHKKMIAINEQMPEGTVPRPVRYMEDMDAILYKEVPGDNGLTVFDQLTETERLGFFKAIGKQTRQFHAVNKEAIAPKDTTTSSLLEHIMQTANRDTFAIIKKRNQDFYGRLHDLYDQIVKRERECIKNSEMVVNHGDLHLGNVIRNSNGKVGLMDLTDVMVAPRAKDIGGFLEQLRSMLHWQGFVDDKKIKGYQQEFLQGYGNDVLVLEEEVRLYRVWQRWRNAMYNAGRVEPDFVQAEEQLASAQELMAGL